MDYQGLDAIVDMFVKLAKKPKWKKQPKGWKDPKSVKKYWESLTEGAEHPFKKCVKEMKGKLKGKGKGKGKTPKERASAFCAKTKDVAEGTTKWRGKEQKKKKKSKKSKK